MFVLNVNCRHSNFGSRVHRFDRPHVNGGERHTYFCGRASVREALRGWAAGETVPASDSEEEEEKPSNGPTALDGPKRERMEFVLRRIFQRYALSVPVPPAPCAAAPLPLPKPPPPPLLLPVSRARTPATVLSPLQCCPIRA